MRNVGVAQPLQRFHGERGAGATSAAQDRATMRIELRPMVLACRTRLELEHHSRGVYRALDRSSLNPVLGFTQVDQPYAPVFELRGELIGPSAAWPR
jgi:hypothetical protein